MTSVTLDVGPHLAKETFLVSDLMDASLYLVYRVNRTDQRLRLIYIGRARDAAADIAAGSQLYQEMVRWAYGDENQLRFSVVRYVGPVDVDLIRRTLACVLRPVLNGDPAPIYAGDSLLIAFEGRAVCGRESILAKGAGCP